MIAQAPLRLCAKRAGPAIPVVERILRQAYGQPRHFNKRDPLSELIFILLSTQTRESKYQRTFAGIWQRYRSWERVRRASPLKLEKLVRFGGLAQRKVALIKAILRRVKADWGHTSLSKLRGMP